jgi:outer membrane protein
MRKLTLLFLLLLATATFTQAQKYGHLNLGNLVASLPETKAADTEVSNFSEQLQTRGEEMATKFRTDYLNLLKDIQAGTLSPVQQQEREKGLEQQQTALQAFELDAQQKVAAKREEVLKPILDKVQAAIESVAKEQGYTMVFDTSVFNAILHVEEADDLMDEVKAKLGVE